MKVSRSHGLAAAAVTVLLALGAQAENTAQQLPTICNPLDLAYRFELSGSFREAADPTAIYFHGQYWIFASKTGGYWHSPDFIHWSLVEPTGLPVEAWAPTVVAIKDRLYFATSDSGVYATDDPARGHWVLVSKDLNVGHDADLFLDDDGRLYLYSGCSDKAPTWGEELDVQHDFKPISPRVNLVYPDLLHRGWEARRSATEPTPGVRPLGGSVAHGTNDPAFGAPPLGGSGDFLTADKANPKAPWIEGSWMNKVNGHYYLQYAAPGTERDTYGDGVFVSDHPLGPFVYQPYSPFSLKPTGFARGAGHSSTFQDAKGNYWHIVTITISKRDMFERRLGVFPVHFFSDGQMACNTYLGDYPQYPPGVADDPFQSNSPGWMLLSLNKPVTASSQLPGFPPSQAVDENLQDWWSAATGNPGEWLQVDLGNACQINALQLNFADQDSHQLGRLHNDAYRYRVDVSNDAKHWTMIVNRENNARDAPHEYVQLDEPQPSSVVANDRRKIPPLLGVRAGSVQPRNEALTNDFTGRYVRITNLHTPAGARFSMSGLRIFGTRPGTAPERAGDIVARRNPNDDRSMEVSWTTSRGAEFYVVRYGVVPDRLYSNFQVYDATNVEIDLLNSGVNYFVTVDAINGSGITPGTSVVAVP